MGHVTGATDATSSESESPPPNFPPTDVESGGAPFGATLEPVLARACDGRLHSIRWFRTDWQRGGALTGYAMYQDDRGMTHDVVVKLPIPPSERQWLVRLQGATNVAPHVYCHGETLNGYDFAWVVMERLPHGPLGTAWGADAFDLLTDAACRFYASAEAFPCGDGRPKDDDIDWLARLDQSRQAVQESAPPQSQRWNKALKKARRKVKEWAAQWAGRALHWRHGDLHLANAMTRTAPPNGPAVLLDYARTGIGHWIEDAIYVEYLYWGKRDLFAGKKICSLIARGRKDHGLFVADDWPRLADVRRLLLAVSVPLMKDHRGDPHHLQASLELLEAGV